MCQVDPLIGTTPDTEVISPPPLREPWLVTARTVWVMLFVLMLLMYVVGFPLHFVHLNMIENGWDLNPERVEALHSFGISVIFRAWYFITIELFTGLMFLIGAIFIFWHKSDDWVVILVSILLITYANTELPFAIRLEQTSEMWRWMVNGVQAIGEVLSLIIFYFFPNGRFVPRWTRPLALFYTGVVLLWFLYPNLPFNIVYGETFDKTPVSSLLIALTVHATSLYALVYRYRHTVNPVLRRQMRWVVFGLTVAFIASTTRYTIDTIVTELALFQTPQERVIYSMILRPAQWLLLTSVPICFFVAILCDRLWSINIIIRRTLVYGALTSILLGIYMLTIGFLSVLFQTRYNNIVISLIGTGIVAVLFQSLREWLRRRISRLLYGERDNPNIVLSRVGTQLETIKVPAVILPSLTETIALTLKLPYVAIALSNYKGQQPNASPIQGSIHPHMNEDRTLGEVVAAYGTPTYGTVHFPLIHQGENIGTLVVAQRAPDEPLSETDHILLVNIARLVGTSAYAVQLTTALQYSRHQLVTAREEERRRLRRDLHDGLGPMLASSTLKIDTIIEEINFDQNAATTMLLELKHTVQDAVVDIRQLVYNLRPPALDELGLIAVLQMLIVQYQSASVKFSLELPSTLPELPAAVEVAIYRIVSEAVTNVVRHATAHTCRIRLIITEAPKTFQLDISDDGTGLPSQLVPGVGLISMRERAEELGGTCIVESAASRGTRVKVMLPLSQ